MDPQQIKQLNAAYSKLKPFERLSSFFKEFSSYCTIVTSSFGSTSPALLHLIRQVKPQQKIHFINTGYHFSETIELKDRIAATFGLTIVEVKPDPNHHHFTSANATWESNPDLCCSVNKTLPFEKIKASADFWITGLIGNQNKYRNQLKIFTLQDGLVKFSPFIDFTTSEIFAYMNTYALPVNELTKKGYQSIGCSHCTSKGQEREGRWKGKIKTECGLHINKASSNSGLRI